MEYTARKFVKIFLPQTYVMQSYLNKITMKVVSKDFVNQNLQTIMLLYMTNIQQFH